MRILLADETNRHPEANDFFIYGGIHFDLDDLVKIDHHISDLRDAHGLKDGEGLKWSPHEVPDRITDDEHIELKSEVIQLAHDVDAQFIPVLISHDIIEDSDGVHFERSIRDLLGQFQYVLEYDYDDYGIAAVDPIPEGRNVKMLEDTFSHGLQFDDRPNIDLSRIKMIATVSSNASHASSIIDIVLGSFRFCVNNPGYDVSRDMFYDIARLTKGYSRERGINYKYGVMIRPANIGNYQEEYRIQYKELEMNLDGLLQRSLEWNAP